MTDHISLQLVVYIQVYIWNFAWVIWLNTFHGWWALGEVLLCYAWRSWAVDGGGVESTCCWSVQLGATYSSLIFRLFLCLTALTDGHEGGGLAHVWCLLKHSGGRTEHPLEGILCRTHFRIKQFEALLWLSWSHVCFPIEVIISCSPVNPREEWVIVNENHTGNRWCCLSQLKSWVFLYMIHWTTWWAYRGLQVSICVFWVNMNELG